MITLLALAALGAGFYMGWRLRGAHEDGRAHREIELAGCPHCRVIYVSPRKTVCGECGSPLHFQYVLTGDCIDAK